MTHRWNMCNLRIGTCVTMGVGTGDVLTDLTRGWGGGRKKGHLRGQKERALARAKNGSGGSTDGPVDFVDRRRYKIVLDITST